MTEPFSEARKQSLEETMPMRQHRPCPDCGYLLVALRVYTTGRGQRIRRPSNLLCPVCLIYFPNPLLHEQQREPHEDPGHTF